MVEGQEVTLYFNTTALPDDDDDTTDDDVTDDDEDKKDDSPFGIEVVLIGIVLAGAIAVYRKRN